MINMLWLDDDAKRPFDEKVKRAADYYQNKYGSTPTVCHVNRAMCAAPKKVDDIQIVPSNTTLVHHFWLLQKPEDAEPERVDTAVLQEA